jgi:hypothetical protein
MDIDRLVNWVKVKIPGDPEKIRAYIENRMKQKL